MSGSPRENINDKFFNGFYKDIWKRLTPEIFTNAEVDFLIRESNLKAGSKVLDLMCGYGRHAIALSKKGIEVTAVDNLEDYINEIKAIVEKENLPIVPLLKNVMQFQPPGNFDTVICLGNNTSFFNEEETRTFFSMIANCLTTGKKFIFNTWMLTEIIVKQFQEKTWNYAGDIKFLSDSKYYFSPSRIETESTFLTPEGKTEIKKAVDYIYSLNETEKQLKEAGLIVKEIWSIPGKKHFTIGEPRAYVVAEKM